MVEQVERNLTIIEKEHKQWSLGAEWMGYSGVHLDVRKELHGGPVAYINRFVDEHTV